MTRLKQFKAHALRKGCDLRLEDSQFVMRKLKTVSEADFKAIVQRYADEWRMGMDDAQTFDTAQDIGRSRANTWLLSHMGELKREKIANEC